MSFATRVTSSQLLCIRANSCCLCCIFFQICFQTQTCCHPVLVFYGLLQPRSFQDSDASASDIEVGHVAESLLCPFESRAQPLCRISVPDLSALVHGSLTSDNPSDYLVSFVRTFQRVAATANLSSSAGSIEEGRIPPLSRLLRKELHAAFEDWDAISASIISPAPAPQPPAVQSLPSLQLILDAAWRTIRSGVCQTAEGTLNKKQAAYLLLVALQLHAQLHGDLSSPNQLLLLLGGPGCGKTYLLGLSFKLRDLFTHDVMVNTAFMHSAARLINGSTLHAALAIPIDSAMQPSTRKHEELQQFWKNKTILRIDEISMISAELFCETQNHCRRFGPCVDLPWGGLQLELSGDLQQLPPVRATSLAATLLPNEAATSAERAVWEVDHATAFTGRRLWTNVQRCIMLDYSHRCAGPLATFLHEMVQGTLSDASWQALQARSLTHPSGVAARAALRSPPFLADSCPVGVLRHTVRASVCFDRAVLFAARAGAQLCVSIAADRCESCTDPSIYRQLTLEHNLTTTSHLPNILYLYIGAPVVLEHKLCVDLGLVRGCACRIARIVFAEDEPSSTANPRVLHFVPSGLILRVLDATWIKHPTLGPGEFYLPCVRRAWKWKQAESPQGGRTSLTVHRIQLPVTNSCGLTAYALQGQTLPTIILDLAKPPYMSRVPGFKTIL